MKTKIIAALLVASATVCSCSQQDYNKYLGDLPLESKKIDAISKSAQTRALQCKQPEEVDKLLTEVQAKIDESNLRMEKTIGNFKFPIEIPFELQDGCPYKVELLNFTEVEKYDNGGTHPYRFFKFEGSVTLKKDTIPGNRPLNIYGFVANREGKPVDLVANTIIDTSKTKSAKHTFVANKTYQFNLSITNSARLTEFNRIVFTCEDEYRRIERKMKSKKDDL